MGVLEAAPGVLGPAAITYVTVREVMQLLGCKENKAYKTIRAVNKIAEDGGYFAYEQGKASKYIFAEKFRIPLDVVDAVIRSNNEQGV